MAQLLFLISPFWALVTSTTVLRFKISSRVLYFILVVLAYFLSIDSVLPGLTTATT